MHNYELISMCYTKAVCEGSPLTFRFACATFKVVSYFWITSSHSSFTFTFLLLQGQTRVCFIKQLFSNELSAVNEMNACNCAQKPCDRFILFGVRLRVIKRWFGVIKLCQRKLALLESTLWSEDQNITVEITQINHSMPLKA